MRSKTCFLFGTLLFCSYLCKAQNIAPLTLDTVNLNVDYAEQRFVSKNITLLIDKYNISIAQANYLQAKLLYNPSLTYSQTLYNQEEHKFFDNDYPLEGAVDHYFQLSQLLTFGRHGANAKLNKIGVKQTQFQLADELRTLKYQMLTEISDLYNNQQLVAMYQSEEVKIQHLIDNTQILYKAGNAAGNDVVRLQAQYEDVVAQQVTGEQNINNDEKDLKTLLLYPEKTYLVVKELLPPVSVNSLPPYQSLLDSAIKNRPDLLLSYQGVVYASQNLKLQQVTGVPDISPQVEYQGAGSVIPAYWGIGASIDLPFFNRNQGNIDVARFQKKEAELTDSLSIYTVKNEVTNAYCNLYRINNQLNHIYPEYPKDLQEMMDNAAKNYDKRIINLLDLLSQISTYMDGETNLINLHVQYFNATQYINYSVGTDIIK